MADEDEGKRRTAAIESDRNATTFALSAGRSARLLLSARRSTRLQPNADPPLRPSTQRNAGYYPCHRTQFRATLEWSVFNQWCRTRTRSDALCYTCTRPRRRTHPARRSLDQGAVCLPEYSKRSLRRHSYRRTMRMVILVRPPAAKSTQSSSRKTR